MPIFGDANTPVKRTLYVELAFAVLVFASYLYGERRIRLHTMELAATEARTVFEVNLAYRRWNASHGGVYAPVTEKFRPNPYLMHQKRDLVASDGTMLTLMNPAIMTRQVHNLLAASSELPVINKVTSLKYLNPLNRPDPWEEQALRSFDAGAKEAIEVSDISGQPYLRLLRPYMTESGCLGCHAVQGYRLGDVRGGLSVGVPMKPFLQHAAGERHDVMTAHLLVWLSGSAGIGLFVGRIRRVRRSAMTSELKFRMLAESSTDWEYWMSENHEILFMTPATLQITGYAPDEFIADRTLIQRIIHPDDRDTYLRQHVDMESIDHGTCQFRIVTRGGSTRWIQHSCTAIYDGGRFVGRRVCNKDITEKVADEDERNHILERLRQTQKQEALGTLASGIAHDFNNILVPIVGYAEMAQPLAGDNPKLAGYLAHIQEASVRARDLVLQILTFSRKTEQRRMPLQMSVVVKEAVKLMRASIPATIAIDHDIATEAMVLADPTQIHQVVINLCTNAFHAMEDSGGTLTVSLRQVDTTERLVAGIDMLPPGSYVALTVGDTGCGMEPAVLARMFEPYFTTKPKGKGTGLGMAVVQGIVRSSGGAIAVRSTPGEGTAVTVYLPRIEPACAVNERADAGQTPKGAGERILLIDDEEPIRNIVSEYLSGNGYVVTTFASGNAALEAFARDPSAFDIAITDMAMPGMDGTALARKIAEIRPDLPIILCSGYSSLVNGQTIGKFGISDFLQKPVAMSEMLRHIRKVLGDRTPPPSA